MDLSIYKNIISTILNFTKFKNKFKYLLNKWINIFLKKCLIHKLINPLKII